MFDAFQIQRRPEDFFVEVSHCDYFFVDSLDTIKLCQFGSGESICFDDVTLDRFTIDEVESFLDVWQDRAVKCRHEDGLIPAGTKRIFLTNHPKHRFFPNDFDSCQHEVAINRRMKWVQVEHKLFATEIQFVPFARPRVPRRGDADHLLEIRVAEDQAVPDADAMVIDDCNNFEADEEAHIALHLDAAMERDGHQPSASHHRRLRSWPGCKIIGRRRIPGAGGEVGGEAELISC